MTAEQLQAARAAHWRQSQDPILTLEDAAGWFLRHPLCLYLPHRAQFPAPAPSFVEACLGRASGEPPQAAIEEANGFLVRLAATGSVIALNLFGASGEQPDFLAHREILPFLVSLRGERDWKHAPGSSAIHKASPLVVEIWQSLAQSGPLTAASLREKLGRELTESAVVRALSELWQSLRAIPVLQPPGKPALWELLETRHSDAVAQGGSTSQVTAISLLVSMYLQSVYAASGDEIEIFLSPLVSRSRIREAVRGLSATRQIRSLSMATETYYFLEDGLPRFAEEEPERPNAVTPRRPRAEEPRRPRAPEWARKAPWKRAREIAASPIAAPKFVAPKTPAAKNARPNAARSGAAKKFVPRTGPDRDDFPRRKDTRPAFGKRSGSPQAHVRTGGQRMAEGHNAREGFPRRQGAPGRPAARTKQRWRNTPGKPGYQPNRASSPGAAPRRPTPARKSSSPAQSRPTPGGFRTARPSMGKPGAGDVGAGRPNVGRPNTGRPGAGRPYTGGPGAGRPNVGRPYTGRPGAGGPGARRPNAGRPNTGRPNTGRPGAARPNAGKPQTSATGRPASAQGGAAGRFPRTGPPFAGELGPRGRQASGKRNFRGGAPERKARERKDLGNKGPGGKDQGKKDRGSENPGKKKPEA